MFFYRHHFIWLKSRELPDIRYADGHGVVAYGGEYSGDCFEKAYRRGIFPWPSGTPDELIPWFCPPERFVLFPNELHLSHSLKQTLRKKRFRICADTAFEEVVHSCAIADRHGDGTWITAGIEKAFGELHERGIAHSVECYENDQLVGGFYGTCIGQVFGGESMFMRVSDATKVAFATFVQRGIAFGIKLIDCQCYTDNMARYGARDIPRNDFLKAFADFSSTPLAPGFWTQPWD